MGNQKVEWERLRSIKSYDQLYAQCTQTEQSIMDELRSLIFKCADFKEKICYGVPYYYRNRQTLFIWPSSAVFGPKQGVLLGFCHGNMMIDNHGLLEKGNRKQVFWITIKSVTESQQYMLRDYIMQAIEIDDAFGAPRSRTKTKPGVKL